MENEKILRDNDEMEIDLLQLFAALKRRFLVIVAAMILCGGIAGAFSKFVLTPQYMSTAMVYILSKETTLTSLADLQIGSQLTKDYSVIIFSRPVLEEVDTTLGLGMSYEELKNRLSINNPADTRVLYISATDPDPYRAKAIADSVAEVSSRYIGDIMEMVPPKLIEGAVVADHKTSPSNGKNAMLGALLGAFIVCGITVLQTVLNDTIQTEEDVENYLGISVLASVPMRSGEEAKGKKSRGRRSSRDHIDRHINKGDRV